MTPDTLSPIIRHPKSSLIDSMPDIVLTTLNARYIHSAIGLRYLKANMGELSSQTTIHEFTIHQQAVEIVEDILEHNPRIVGVGVYIWNTELCTTVVGILKRVRPDICVIVGGPEVSYESEQQTICRTADYTVCGAADLHFADLCRKVLSGNKPDDRIQYARPVDLKDLVLPYDLYNEEDVAHRIIYVEASRGCPFKCEFCLSALDKTAKPFEIEKFLDAMQKLIDRGVKHFKFIDRTFNLKVSTSIRILEFFLQQTDKGIFLHFELIPDHLPDALKNVLLRFPPHSLQFEIGIQSFQDNVQTLISRKQDNQKSRDNIRWLREKTYAHLHTDLIIGLPGMTMEIFADDFDQLVSLKPHEIQVGVLKRLRGTPIIRHTEDYSMRYNPEPPYNILSTADIDFTHMQRLSRFARYWDMIANSGRFPSTKSAILDNDPYNRFMTLSDWLYKTTKQTHKIALKRLFVLLYDGMRESLDMSHQDASNVLESDFSHNKIKGRLPFLDSDNINDKLPAVKSAMQRQNRHRMN